MNKILISIFIFIFIAGCSGMKDRERTKTEGAVVGSAIGAGLGALVGQYFGGGKGTLIGAGVGASVGGLAGAAYGDHVANKKAEFASKEAYLKACITSRLSHKNIKYNFNLLKLY
jgi:uncharacterized protein YcfJ